MKLRPFLYALAVLVPVAAYAQPAPQQTPREQALTQRLIGEINNGLSCQTDAIALQQQVQKLQAELAEAKKEPKDGNDNAAKKKP